MGKNVSETERPFQIKGLVDRIRQVAQLVGGIKALSEKAEIPLGTLNGYLAGRKITAENLAAISLATDVSLDWLAKGGSHLFTQDAVASFQDATDSDVVAIPRFEMRAAAGSESLAESEHALDYVRFPSYLLRRTVTVEPSQLVLIQATGVSMEPTIRDGELLFVDASVTEIEEQGVYVVVIDGEVSVRWVQRRPGGGLVIRSDNPSYESVTLEPGELDHARIAGRVRSVVRAI